MLIVSALSVESDVLSVPEAVVLLDDEVEVEAVTDEVLSAAEAACEPAP